MQIKTIDAHAAGEPLRLIVDGFPRPEGRTMLEKRQWLRERSIEASLRVVHPHEPGLHGIYGTIFTRPAFVAGCRSQERHDLW